MADDKRDILELLDLVKDAAPPGKTLRVSIRRLPADRSGGRAVTVDSFLAERDDELLERIQARIEEHAHTGTYEIRIREREPNGFDATCSEYREFAARHANPVELAPAPNSPATSRLHKLMEQMLEQAIAETLTQKFAPREEVEEEEPEDAADDDSAAPGGTLGELLKDESFKLGIGRVLAGLGQTVENAAEFIAARTTAAASAPATAPATPLPLRIVQGTIKKGA